MLAVAGHPHVRSKISLSCFAGSPNPVSRSTCVRARHVFKLRLWSSGFVCCRTAVPARGIRAIPAPFTFRQGSRSEGAQSALRACVPRLIRRHSLTQPPRGNAKAPHMRRGVALCLALALLLLALEQCDASKDYYKWLGVPRNANDRQIKKGASMHNVTRQCVSGSLL
jgi:hypothetical protein